MQAASAVTSFLLPKVRQVVRTTMSSTIIIMIITTTIIVAVAGAVVATGFLIMERYACSC